ncbi:MAG: LacI family transcriptional regulator [Gemmatimonadetes bacterium]|nr:LacI family transcriptional regulator [Gemmatimonadota bacterium]MYD26742.1 LacI family transcriptional regulator [Gemmatimonadota bacterium]MYI99152.1 LacI family transcriptional regulator [Gemmatimonadota bacterium]
MRNRPVTIKDIARRLGISYSTVSRALSPRMSHLVKEQTRLLVRRTAAEMDYSPNLLAQAFVQGTEGVLGLVTNRIGQEFTGRQIDHLVQAAAREGYQVLVAAVSSRTASSGKTESAERSAQAQQIDQFMHLKARDVDGILVQALGDESESARIVHSAGGKLPVAAFGYAVDDVSSVLLNPAPGMQAVTEHLIGLGHERICFLGEDPIGSGGPRSHVKGYRSAMRRHGLTPRIVPVDSGSARSGYNLGRALHGRYTAIACCSDYTALGVCRGLIESGVRVPGDMAVTGFGNGEVSAYVRPSLTTLSIPFEDMAARAVQDILHQIRGRPGPRRSVFTPHLSVRESCGAG